MMTNKLNHYLEFDRNHIWHPYTSMTEPLPNYYVKDAQGVYLMLSDGQCLIDGTASWWSAIHGYNHPILNMAVQEQAGKMAHVMFGGLTHQPAIELCQRLIELTPPSLDKVFLSDSGSVAVEVALKMALQYWSSQGKQEKHKFLALKKGYHGDTFAAMSVCDPNTGMHHLFKDVLPQHYFAEEPQCRFDDVWDDKDLNSVTEILQANNGHIAAVILEPIVQATGGIRFYNPEYLVQLRRLCDQLNVLLIFDEIATGFGRTGTMFACEHSKVEPDIMCIGKSLAGGYMSLAATLTSQSVSAGICANDHLLMHGPTFMANPLACATACASIDLLLSQPWRTMVNNIEAQLKEEMSHCMSLPQVADVRCLGAIGVVETVHNVNLASIQKKFVEKGVWVRPFGNLIYVMPPYVINSSELSHLNHAIYEVVKTL